MDAITGFRSTPERDSMTVGISATARAMSEVSLETPVPSPMVTIVMRSVFDNGSATAVAISGSAVISSCRTAAWLYSFHESAFLSMAWPRRLPAAR
jgi:hypothetical protein